ncbi:MULTISPECIES: oligosaccharide flippase family protein [Bacteroides]|uniref:oligosaccharide flippase family protein n=1 Tax=Bacteroides TaxID=816 RepID=UPI000E43A4DB|nr:MULTISPECIES: oligosaccharide flippase family protein [Bacteroides]RGM44879.1 polysaccharide biosynthesis protein [Bacteroides sp. OM08-11]
MDNSGKYINKRTNIVLYAIDRFLQEFVNVIVKLLDRFTTIDIYSKFSAHQGTMQNVIGLLAFNALGGLLIIVTNIKLANILGAAVFGIYSYYLAIGEIGSNIVRYGRHKTMLRELVQYPDKRNITITYTVWISIINLILFLATIIVFHNQMDIQLSIVAILLILSPCLISLDFQPVYESFRLISWHSIYYLIQKILFIVGVWVILLINNRLSIGNAAIILFLSWIIVVVIQYWEVIHQLHINIFKQFKIRDLFRFYKSGFIIAVVCVLGCAFGPIIQMIMKQSSNEISVGLYAACLQLLTIAKFILNQMARVGNPKMAEICMVGYDKQRKRSFLKKYIFIMILSVLPFVIPMFICPDLIVKSLFSSEYLEISSALPICAVYLILSSIGAVFNQFLVSYRADKIYIIFYSIAAIVSIIIAVLMIPYYGFLGGVLAFCISDGLASILYTIMSLNILRNEI